MRNSLRLGVFRDKDVFGQYLGDDSAIVVPAHIAAYATDGLWGFLKGIADARGTASIDYYFDPMTYWLDLPTAYWARKPAEGPPQPFDLPLADDKEAKASVKPALLALLREYGLAGQLTSKDDPAAIRAEFVAGGVRECLDFQRRGSDEKRKRTVDKYAQMLELGGEEASGMAPSCLVAPYVSLAGLGEADVADQATLNTASLTERAAGETMRCVLALDSRQEMGRISSRTRTKLRLDEFARVGVWVSDLDEYNTPADALKRYRSLLASVGRPVWVMYGGYFSLLLRGDGVSEVSHGIYYTESKRMRGAVGSGPAPERYYIPCLHRFFEPARAFELLAKAPDLRCDCPECESLESLVAEAAGAAATSSKRMAWAKRLQRHFLAARAREAKDATDKPLVELLEQLKEANAIVRALDADLRRRSGVGEYLNQWIEALK
jgi:hypothetical protein